MKARLKSTGHIIDVYYDRDDPSILVGKSGLHYSKDVLDIIYTPDYWEKLKHQAAINIYCAHVENNGCEWSLDQAIKEVTALVNKLKESKV